MRKDYVKDCITSAAFLVRGCPDQEQANAILERARAILNDVWVVEFKTYTEPDTQTQMFWDLISLELRRDGKLNEFSFVCGEMVNPPGTHGRVCLRIQPKNSIASIGFELKAIS